ncbi:MAG: ribonuclease HII [Flavobacteriales bacterium]
MLKTQYKPKLLEAGCDEAGRGCLAGPVTAAAVILPHNFSCKLLNDSKQLSNKKRYELRKIIEQEAIAYAVAFVDHQKIDKINILHASILAMHQALDGLKTIPQHIIVDGNKFKPYRKIPHQTIVKGDGKYLNIVAASILAKTYRDDFMFNLHQQYSHYGWDKNKGYPTKKHREGIRKHGITPYHRMSFKLLENQLMLGL